MITKEFKLSEQELQQYNQIEASITHWSKEHTKAQLQTQRLLNAVNSMYEGRMQLVNQLMTVAGIDPTHVHQANINEKGEVKVAYDDSVPNPAADPAEVQAVSPTANPAGSSGA